MDLENALGKMKWEAVWYVLRMYRGATSKLLNGEKIFKKDINRYMCL